MTKKEFTWWNRDMTWVKVIENEEDFLELLFLGNVSPKKNSRRVFRHTVLPSENYMEWHKRCMEDIWHYNIKLLYNEWTPFTMEINTIAWNKVKWDIDNLTQSIMDFCKDAWIIIDDNKFVISDLKISCLWYIKNLPLTQVKIYPNHISKYNSAEDHKDKSIDELVHIAHHLFN